MASEGFQRSECAVSVLGSFGFWLGGKPRRGLPHGSQRLLAFLALRDRAVTRAATAGTLWPEASEDHAHASLRSAIARLIGLDRTVVRVSSQELALADGVVVDIRDARALAHRLLDSGVDRNLDLGHMAISTLSVDLLADWYDDWALAEGEAWRQLRLHALDALAARLTVSGRYADATSAALAAIKAEPLRETAHAALIGVYLAEGNRDEALAAYERYRLMMRTEMRLEPTELIQSLVEHLEKA